MIENALTSGILTSLPGRYAKAIFDLAHEKKQAEAVGSSLNSLEKLIQSSTVLKNALANPTISLEDHTAAIKEICVHMKAPKLFSSFIEHLVKAQRMPYLSKINEIYQVFVLEEKGEQKIEVISAHPLTTSQTTLLKDKLKKVFPKTLTLTFINDSDVLGGIMVPVGCRVIDATLVTQLNQLATVMKGSA